MTTRYQLPVCAVHDRLTQRTTQTMEFVSTNAREYKQTLCLSRKNSVTNSSVCNRGFNARKVGIFDETKLGGSLSSLFVTTIRVGLNDKKNN